MAEIVGVVFRGGVKVYHFDPAGLELSRGDRVVVQTISGPEIGQVVEPPKIVDDSELPAPLKKVVRIATGKDLQSQVASEGLRRQAMETCRELIAAHGLDMKLVGADIGFGGEKITFSFYADERVDFRELVADLARTLKMRIELRQVGAREEARMVGGLGPCGRGLCCTLFAGDDEPVSIRMAKEQNLPLNPMKISGLCGRLMCCLKYEQEQYVRFRKEAPAKGTPASTPRGEGVVAGYSVTKDALMVRLEDGSFTEVKLSTCELQEGGGLLVVPEVKEPAYIPMLDDLSGLKELAAEENGSEDLPVVEAEVVLGADGEPVEVIVAESSRRGRGRRGRGRRRSKGRGQVEAAGSAGAAAAGQHAAAAAGSGESPGRGAAAGAGSKRERRSSHRGERRSAHAERESPRGERQQKQERPSQRGAADEQAGSTSTGTHPRRRRRPRRPAGGGADGDPGTGSDVGGRPDAGGGAGDGL
ncbi:MAG: stage 0 sporulation family protein [Actinomycetia bacterium]|nr:stage 0 sporulation family protein [Actinomycetes bacterium]